MRSITLTLVLSALSSTLFAQSTEARFTKIGTGCAAIRGGQAAPVLDAAPGNLPVFGSTFTTTVSNLNIAGSTAVGVVGLSDQTWSGIPLPLDLTPFGLVGCTLYTDPLVTMPLPNAGGTGRWSLFIPNVPSLQSQSFFQQAVIFAPGANPVGVLFSNGAKSQIGTEIIES